MRQPDHWYARNFAKDDASTREHVRQTLIPSWQERIRENEKAIGHLRRCGRDKTDPILSLVADETEDLRANIEVAKARLNDWEKSQNTPIPMVLHCPQCGTQHIDAPDPASGWDNPPHRSHLCNTCGTIWRPADVPTSGVKAISSRGHSDTWPSSENGIDPAAFSFRAHLARQRAWSERTFGPGDRTQGTINHIRKELREIEAEPGDLTEWIDVVLLALDGAWRSGANTDEIIEALAAKQAKNESRTWPDWRTVEPGKAIEHIREPVPGA